MRWQRLGCVFSPEGQRPWMKSHASNPVAEPLGGDLFRVYFGCRDDRNRTHVGAVVIELGERFKLLDIAPEPALAPGEPGLFDDSGTSVACLVPNGQETWLFYIGWNLRSQFPFATRSAWRSVAGRQPVCQARVRPVIDRSNADPLSLSYPWVLHEPDGWHSGTARTSLGGRGPAT